MEKYSEQNSRSPEGIPNSSGTNPPKLKAPAGAVLSFAIFAVLLAIYAFSTVRTSADSRWSLHTAMSLLRGHGGDLTEYMPALERNNFYAITYPGGRPHTYFPIGVSILAMPAVAIAWLVRPALFEELQQGVPDSFRKIRGQHHRRDGCRSIFLAHLQPI